MRILIIGGTRIIGPRVVRRLAEQGHEVIVFHRGQHRAPLPQGVVHIAHPDAAMPIRQIPEALRALEPEIVLHMIAMGEADGVAAANAFAGVARRMIMPSSGDVYKAYGIFRGSEPGPLVPVPMNEDAPLRDTRHPYRLPDTPAEALEYYYDKILAEQAFSSRAELPATILRLPKVYGPQENANLATVYAFRRRANWRWTHGYVENVAAAIALAVLDDRATGRIYNVGEPETPTMAERLADLPKRSDLPLFSKAAHFEQDIAYDTGRIRRELDYREAVDERSAMREIAIAST